MSRQRAAAAVFNAGPLQTVRVDNEEQAIKKEPGGAVASAVGDIVTVAAAAAIPEV